MRAAVNRVRPGSSPGLGASFPARCKVHRQIYKLISARLAHGPGSIPGAGTKICSVCSLVTAPLLQRGNKQSSILWRSTILRRDSQGRWN